MSEPILQIIARTARFNFTNVQPHFINPCCFGEDFAAWLRTQLLGLTSRGFHLSQPIQEDYGWGLWASRGKDTFWIALSSSQDGDVDSASPRPDYGEWVVSITYDPGLNLFRRLFHRVGPSAGAEVARDVEAALKAAPDIRVLPCPG